MATALSLLKLAAVLAAAIFIGNWYQSELRKNRAAGKPWHHIYASPPGILIIIAILLPLLVWMFKFGR